MDFLSSSSFGISGGDFWIYRAQREARIEGVHCIQVYYDQKGDGRCSTIFPARLSIAPFLDQAKRLNASFHREATANRESREEIKHIKPG